MLTEGSESGPGGARPGRLLPLDAPNQTFCSEEVTNKAKQL